MQFLRLTGDVLNVSPCHPPWELSQWCPLHTVLVPRVTRPPGSSHPLSWPVTTTWHCHDVTLRLCYNVSREAPAEITDSYLSSVINGGLRSNQHHHQHAETRDYWRHWGSVMFIITMSPFYDIFLASGLTEVVSQTPREAPEEGQGQRMTSSPRVECIVTPVTRRTSRQCRYIRGSRGPGLSPGSRRSGSIFTKHLGATNWTWSSFSRWWPPRLSLTQPPSPGCRGNEIVELMNGQCIHYFEASSLGWWPEPSVSVRGRQSAMTTPRGTWGRESGEREGRRHKAEQAIMEVFQPWAPVCTNWIW